MIIQLIKINKNAFKSSLSQNNLKNLRNKNIESECEKSLDFEEVIQIFANDKARKKDFCFDDEDKQVYSCDDDSD